MTFSRHQTVAILQRAQLVSLLLRLRRLGLLKTGPDGAVEWDTVIHTRNNPIRRWGWTKQRMVDTS